MKKMIYLFIVICILFTTKTVDAALNINVGGTNRIFGDSTCQIVNCSTNSSNVTLTFDSSVCRATGVSVGSAQVNVTCEGQTEVRNIDLNIIENINSTNDGSTLYDNVTNAEVNCSSLGLLRKDLNGIFSVIKIVAPILVVVMSIYDFIKAITGKVEGDIKKAFIKFLKRLVFAMILFFLPAILDFFLGLVDPGYTTCINS